MKVHETTPETENKPGTSIAFELPQKDCEQKKTDRKSWISLHCIATTPRKCCIWLIERPWFDRVTLLIIVASCIMISNYNYCDEQLHCSTKKCLAAIIVDHVIYAYFVFEMLCKMVGLGLCSSNGYFSDNWNKMDFFIVLTGAVEYTVQALSLEVNMRALRILRIIQRTLKPLKTIHNVAALRIVINMIMDTAGMLLNVLLVCFLVFFVFGLIAVQLWAGLLRGRCTTSDFYDQNISRNTPSLLDYPNSKFEILYGDYACSLPQNNGIIKCEDLSNKWCKGIFSSNNESCNETMYNTCILGDENPFNGALNFDNIFYSWVTIYIVITLSGWSEIMYLVQDAHSFWDFIYFILLIVVGAMFTVNLFLVVLTTQISITKTRELRNIEENNDDQGEFAGKDGKNQGSLYEMLLNWLVSMCKTIWNQLYMVLFCKKCGCGQKETIALQKKSAANSDATAKIDSKFWSSAKCVSTWLERVVKDKKFSSVILTAIVLNSFLMSIEHHKQPLLLTTINESLNYVFTLIFTVEMVFKLIGFGFIGYFKDSLNLLDCFTVIVSLLELANVGPSGLSVLRAFRLLRLIKLIKFLPMLRKLLAVIIHTLDEIAVFLGIFCLVILIFSLAGMTLFGERLSTMNNGTQCSCMEMLDPGFQCRQPRINFDTLFGAALTVFQVLTKDNWKAILFNAMHYTSHWTAALYFIALYTIGNYVTLNLVVAILVQGCMDHSDKCESTSSQGDTKHKEAGCMEPECNLNQETMKSHVKATESKANDEFSKDKLKIQLFSNEKLHETGLIDVAAIVETRRQSLSQINSSITNYLMETDIEEKSVQRFIDENDKESILRLSKKFGGKFSIRENPMQCPVMSTSRITMLEDSTPCIEIQKTGVKKSVSQDLDYPYFPKPCFVRRFCIWCIHQKWFDSVILIFIITNCITMAIERPSIPKNSTERQILDVLNHIFTGIFLIELVIKVTALGLVCTKNAYFRSAWNILDGLLVLISMVNLAFDLLSGNAPQIFDIIRVLRLLRALRPLRVVNRAPGLKVTIESLIHSMKDLGNLLMLSLGFFIVFGILGVQLFKGILYQCTGPDISNVASKFDCQQEAENQWVNSKFNFDNLFQALLTLYVVSTMDGWTEIMHGTIDAVGEDLQPILNYNTWRVFYFIPFVVLMTFLIMNMMIGVLVDNYYEVSARIKKDDQKRTDENKNRAGFCGAENDTHPYRNCIAEEDKRSNNTFLQLGHALLSMKFSHTTDERLNVAPATTSHDHEPWLKKKTKRFVTNKKFDVTVGAVIAVNIVVMATEHYQMSLPVETFHMVSNYVFTLIFAMEALLKILGLGFKCYIKERWNQLDCLIVILSIAGIVIEQAVAGSHLGVKTKLLRILRMVRITRVLKLLKQATGFMSLVNTMGNALPQIGNLGLLLGLQLFIFSAVAVELFGRIECSIDHPCIALSDEHANFKHFGMAMLTLFRVATGDNWSGILKDTLKDDCDSSSACETNCCTNSALSKLYFVTFVILTQFIMLNVVVALMMKGFTDAQCREDDSLIGCGAWFRLDREKYPDPEFPREVRCGEKASQGKPEESKDEERQSVEDRVEQRQKEAASS